MGHLYALLHERQVRKRGQDTLHTHNMPDQALLYRTAMKGKESSTNAEEATSEIETSECGAGEKDAGLISVREDPPSLQADHRQHASPPEGDASLQAPVRLSSRAALNKRGARAKSEHRQRTIAGGMGARARRAERRATLLQNRRAPAPPKETEGADELMSYEEACSTGLID